MINLYICICIEASHLGRIYYVVATLFSDKFEDEMITIAKNLTETGIYQFEINFKIIYCFIIDNNR